ncbi:unknown [Prevotella sp. CAG:474]|nr:unknown [Prevotella sp. CAG:474]
MPRQTKIFCIIFVNVPVFLFRRQTVHALRGHEAKAAQQPSIFISNCELLIAGRATIISNHAFTISRLEVRLGMVAMPSVVSIDQMSSSQIYASDTCSLLWMARTHGNSVGGAIT